MYTLTWNRRDSAEQGSGEASGSSLLGVSGLVEEEATERG